MKNLKKSLPQFSDEVYNDLPPTISELCSLVPGSRAKRDVYLLGLIGTLSAAFPNVRFAHGTEWYSPHLYVFIGAPAGSGKAVVRMAARVNDETDKQIRQRSDLEQASWQAEKDASRHNSKIPIIPIIPPG